MKKLRFFLTGIILSISMALAVFLGFSLMAEEAGRPILPVFGQGAERVVVPGAVLREENRYLCGDTELIFQGPAPSDIIGKSLKELRSRYPEDKGWSIDIENEKKINLRRNVEDFCGDHGRYRHLGIYRERLAVYQGPLGFDHRLLRVEENKPLERLPQPFREKLSKSMEFNNLTPDEKSSLRCDLEFTDESLLNSTLENLDEAAD